MEINLEDYSLKTKVYDFDCEFPVCEDSDVGNEWRYSYFISKTKAASILCYNTLVRFDRISENSIKKDFG